MLTEHLTEANSLKRKRKEKKHFLLEIDSDFAFERKTACACKRKTVRRLMRCTFSPKFLINLWHLCVGSFVWQNKNEKVCQARNTPRRLTAIVRSFIARKSSKTNQQTKEKSKGHCHTLKFQTLHLHQWQPTTKVHFCS